jgi:hypothetical protein
VKKVLHASVEDKRSFILKLIGFSKCGGNQKLEVYNKLKDGIVWRCTRYNCGKRFSIRHMAHPLFTDHRRLSLAKLVRFIFVHWYRLAYNDSIMLDLNISEVSIAKLRLTMQKTIRVYRFYHQYKFG